MASKLSIGLSLSLSGRYAAMGRQAEAALRLFVADQNGAGGLELGGKRFELALECHDDRSDATCCAGIYRSLCFENRADFIFGPYSSELARAAAPIAENARMVFVNHGGAHDDLYRRSSRLIVGVLSSASDYFRGFAQLLGTLKFWRKRLALISSSAGFGRSVIDGLTESCLERAVYRRGVRIRLRQVQSGEEQISIAELLSQLRRLRINALVSAGSFEADLALMRAVIQADLNIPVLACVAAGVADFRSRLGTAADGVIGPSQWEESVEIKPEMGPTPANFSRRMREVNPDLGCDYPAAQIYAAGLLTLGALRAADSIEQPALRRAFGDLRTTTLFGDFALDRVTGRQVGHKMLLVQWHENQKVVIHPDAHAEVGSLDFPSGWRLILASLRGLRLQHGAQHSDERER